MDESWPADDIPSSFYARDRSVVERQLDRIDRQSRRSSVAMPSPPQVRVTPYRDGPLIVRGASRIVEADGSELATRRDPIALCRCGKSRLRPFCDGTHKLIGFRADGVPGSADVDWLGDLARLGIEIP